MAGAGWFGIGWEWWILYGEILSIGAVLYLALTGATQTIYTTICAGCDGIGDRVKDLEHAVRETARD